MFPENRVAEFLDDFNPVRYETDKSFREGVIRRFMADLERSQLPTEEEIMTLIGADDDVVSIRALFEYHFALQQDKKGLETFPKIGHDIPEDISNPLLEKFFTEHLLS